MQCNQHLHNMSVFGAIASGLTLGSSIFNSIQNKKTQERNNRLQREHEANMLAKQHQYNTELAKYTYDLDLEQWNRQNEYNSPASQMSRFMEAGLNPNLIYGQGTPGNATSSPSYNQEGVDFMHTTSKQGSPLLLGELGNYLMDGVAKGASLTNTRASTANIMAQTGLIGSQRDKNEAEANLAIARAAGQAIANARGKLSLQQETELYETQIDAIKQALSNARKTGENLDLDNTIKRYQGNILQFEDEIKTTGLKDAPSWLRFLILSMANGNSDSPLLRALQEFDARHKR